MTEKVTKESVDYRRSDGPDHCGACVMFRHPNRCTLVLGIIREEDTCDRFKRRKKVDARIAELWEEGVIARIIAEVVNKEFGLDFTRNAIIGRKHRMKLTPHHRPTRFFARVINDPGPQPLVPGEAAFLDLDNHACHWPMNVNDLGSVADKFCGRGGVDVLMGRPYCEEHRRRAYQR